MIMLLSGLIASGIIGSVTTLMLRERVDARHVALFTSLVGLLLFSILTQYMDFNNQALQLTEMYQWIPFLNIQFILGIDGLSWVLVGLTLFINFIVVLVAYQQDYDNMGFYLALFLFMQSMVIGVFLAFDAILFYMFWEGMLIPMYLCIGIWGAGKRSQAAIKFFLYTFLGSIFMLAGLVYMGMQTGSFSFLDMMQKGFSLYEQKWLFLALLFAFAVKIPMFPLHTWLPDAHTEAPASGSVILAALMLKVGAYGLMRLSLPILPQASAYFAPLMVGLSLIAILYVGVVAYAQTDIKRLIAYSSVAHMGFVTLGIFLVFMTNSLQIANLSFMGALIQMIAHAFGSGALFLAFGLLYKRYPHRERSDFSGLAQQMPWFTMFFLLFVLSTMGVPLTAGFVGEWMVIVACIASKPLLGSITALTVVLASAYLLSMFRSVFFGTPNASIQALQDIRLSEKALLFLVACVIVGIGIYPQVFATTAGPAVESLTEVALRPTIGVRR